MKIGILDIQGSVEEHFAALQKIKNVEPVLVKNKKDLDQVKGLIMPGGESTTIGKLLRRFGLREEIIKRAKAGMPVWGTCAGAILLAKKIVGTQTADGLKLMDIAIERNAYGRQVDSFETQIEFDLGTYGGDYFGKVVPAIFIRAPKILAVGKKVQILAKHRGEIVAARQGNLMASSFHPELTDSKEIHEYFVKMCG
ncbi:MAG: pyridoxal 5'-phosphate synthase glutaminase subunit PdxT [Patescibacteria group bacterium]